MSFHRCRRHPVKWVAIAVVVALGVLGGSYYAFFVRPEKQAERARPVAPETLQVATVSGTVEVAGPDGVFRAARPGDTLSARDRIRTGDEGDAQLRAADGSTVRLLAATDARVDELRRELKRLRLGAGMVEADVQDDPTRVFEVAFDGEPDGGAVARTRGAAFTATSNGAGTSAVASRRGEVILSARGKEVVIRSGQFARISPGGAPEAPQPLPPSLFLKVAWPAATSSKPRLTVSGETMPGARVKIGTRWVQVDHKGHYKRELEVPDGTHELQVHAVDVGGHVVDEKSPRIVVDTRTDFKIQSPKWK
jgi:hypothetical protein